MVAPPPVRRGARGRRAGPEHRPPCRPEATAPARTPRQRPADRSDTSEVAGREHCASRSADRRRQERAARRIGNRGVARTFVYVFRHPRAALPAMVAAWGRVRSSLTRSCTVRAALVAAARAAGRSWPTLGSPSWRGTVGANSAGPARRPRRAARRPPGGRSTSWSCWTTRAGSSRSWRPGSGPTRTIARPARRLHPAPPSCSSCRKSALASTASFELALLAPLSRLRLVPADSGGCAGDPPAPSDHEHRGLRGTRATPDPRSS